MDGELRPGHDLRHCKLPSCPNECDPDAPTRGLWANMCTPCRKGETPQGVIYKEQHASPTRQTFADLADGTLEQRARAIVPLARKLEVKVRAHKAAKSDSVAAVKAFSGALTDLRDAAQAMIGPTDG